jgi:hypothetical protein
MKPRILVLFAFAALAAAQSHAQSSVYRWVDQDGKVHFSDAPPPDSAKEVTQKRMGSGGYDEGQLPYATQQAMRRSPVTLYSSGNCGELCANGRTLLVNRGIPYSEKDGASEAETIKKLTGALQVPVLVVGDRALSGFSEDAWNASLDSAGYPKTKVPGQYAPPPPPIPQPAPPKPAAAPAAPGTTQ